MPQRRAILVAALAGSCAGPVPPRTARPLGTEGVIAAAEAWHVDLCLPGAAVRGGALAPFAADATGAAGFAFGFGLESWMRADRPGSAEALAALGGGPAVVSVRALAASVPPGAEDQVALRLPEGGTAAIARFILGQVAAPVPPAPASGAWLLVPSRLPYSIGFTCNGWVMRALAEAGLPVPVEGIRLRSAAIAAVRAEAARQAAV
ncbi:DUF2459 domain-containing protein [Roseomonas sp. HF4]|uniref:DUF2459 domain-containing protein n=1 Tax=Roseomonas sp. HF4 TaxID=2562313 RepID=UPI0010BF838B|nr:DUF2459 domain-containing protein [Roseomonas sp. HF4]